MIYPVLPTLIQIKRKTLVPINIDVSKKKLKKYLNSEKITYEVIHVLAKNLRGKMNDKGKIHKPVQHIMVDKWYIKDIIKHFEEE